MKTTAQPARALSSRAVGLGAWLVPPIGSGRSERHENGPASIAAWLPSVYALTVGVLLAFSGWSSKRRTVWRMVSGCTFSSSFPVEGLALFSDDIVWLSLPFFRFPYQALLSKSRWASKMFNMAKRSFEVLRVSA